MTRTTSRKAHFCVACWRELSLLDLAVRAYGCPHCGSALCDEDIMTRVVPVVPRRRFRTGLEPIFALWAEGVRELRRRFLLARLAELDPTDMRLPRLRLELARLEEEGEANA